MVKISKNILIKSRKYFLIILGVVLLVGAGFYFWQSYGWRIGVDTSCIEIKEKNLIGYYDCNEIKRGQIAIVKFLAREETFVKKIVGLPGDKLEFTEENQLKLNGEILKNSAEEPYLFSERSQRILTIPLKDGKIPEGRYFVLSEEKGPSAFDSRQFGFLEKEHFKGRVVKPSILDLWIKQFHQK